MSANVPDQIIEVAAQAFRTQPPTSLNAEIHAALTASHDAGLILWTSELEEVGEMHPARVSVHPSTRRNTDAHRECQPVWRRRGGR